LKLVENPILKLYLEMNWSYFLLIHLRCKEVEWNILVRYGTFNSIGTGIRTWQQKDHELLHEPTIVRTSMAYSCTTSIGNHKVHFCIDLLVWNNHVRDGWCVAILIKLHVLLKSMNLAIPSFYINLSYIIKVLDVKGKLMR